MTSRYEYAGFWIRVAASLIDTLIMLLVCTPIVIVYYGTDRYFEVLNNGGFLGWFDVVISWILPVVATIWFWRHKQATPGKLIFSLKVLDEETGQTLTLKQSVIRYLGYVVCTFSLFIGFFWIGFDAKKQGWHDKMAKTVVVKDLQA